MRWPICGLPAQFCSRSPDDKSHDRIGHGVTLLPFRRFFLVAQR
jgi:hypothetical protein